MLGWVSLLVLLITTTPALRVDVKVVDSHSQIGQTGNHGFLRPRQLTPTKEPGPLCAHPSLAQLKGKCYSLELDKYRYDVCPFNNVTQHEIANRWNAYHGILGIWSHWTYTDTYSKLQDGVYTAGDSCEKEGRGVARSVTLQHRCGEGTAVVSVTEPHTCQYLILFTCPVFCHPVFVDVLSSLQVDVQTAYARTTLQYDNNILTAAGLAAERTALLQSTGCLSRDRHFDHLPDCVAAYNHLHKQHHQLAEEHQGRDESEEGWKGRYEELQSLLQESGLILPGT